MARASAAIFGLILCAGRAHAQSPSSPPNDVPAAEPKPTKTATRPLPERARGYAQPPRAPLADVTLFVPRLVLGVPRLAIRLVFWPVQKTLAFMDEHAVVQRVKDVLYNDERTAGIVPKLSVDSFFGVSLGAKAFHENLAGHGEAASIEARFGGFYRSAAQLAFRANHFGGSPLWLESLTRQDSKPGLLFEGIGEPAVRADGHDLDPRQAAVETRFHERRLLALLRGGYSIDLRHGLLQLGATALYSVRDFGPRQAGDDPSIETVYDTSKLIGFDRRVPVLESDLNFVLDTRDVAGATSSGTYLEAFAGHGKGAPGYDFWHHGAEAVHYFDLYRKTRVLIVRGVVEGVEGASEKIPFAELPRLGGPNRLRGYPLDRFRDEKALLGTLEYHYPIHQFVSGALYVDVGKVSRSYSGMLDRNAWKVGGGGGFIFRSRDKLSFAFDIAYGDGLQLLLTADPLRAFAKRDTEL